MMVGGAISAAPLSADGAGRVFFAGVLERSGAAAGPGARTAFLAGALETAAAADPARASLGVPVGVAESALPADKSRAFIDWVPVRTGGTQVWSLVRTGRR
jgi:hypothetical protein